MDKTPVTLLQELSVTKFSSRPIYTIIYDVECFKCKVECLGLEAIGVGARKQTAKQDAAKNLLLSIRHGETQITEDIPLPSKVAECRINNFVGALQDYCAGKKLATPVYQELAYENEGNRGTFAIKCIVHSYTATGSGSTKKLAKQNAARTMLEQLEGCMSLDLDTKSSQSSINIPSTCKMEESHSNCNSEDNHNLSLAYDTQKEPEIKLDFNLLKTKLLLLLGRQANDFNSLDSDDDIQ